MPLTKLPYQHLSDMELFALVKEDDIDAFEAIYKHLWPGLIDAAYRRLGSRQKAEDIVQELFISLYNKRATLQLTVSLKAYLAQALKFKILNEFRSQHVRNAYAKTVFFNDYCKNDLANNLEVKELRHKIDGVLLQLPQKCRQVFSLSRSENKTHKEIATALNISVSTVEKHIGKAIKTLKAHLEAQA